MLGMVDCKSFGNYTTVKEGIGYYIKVVFSVTFF